MKVGVIGLGSIGMRHVRNLLEMGETDVLGYDIRIGEPGFSCEPIQGTNSVDMLWQWEPEAVIIATAPEMHAWLACEALRRIVSCFIEKPLAMNVHDAERICMLAENNKLHVAIGYQLLACPSVRAFPREWKSLSIWDRQDMAAWPTATYQRNLLLEYSHEISLAIHWAGAPPCAASIAWLDEMNCTVYLSWPDGRAASIDLSGNADGYSRGARTELATWEFSREENDAAYRDELLAFLRGEPICTGTHAVHVAQTLEKLC